MTFNWSLENFLKAKNCTGIKHCCTNKKFNLWVTNTLKLSWKLAYICDSAAFLQLLFRTKIWHYKPFILSKSFIKINLVVKRVIPCNLTFSVSICLELLKVPCILHLHPLYIGIPNPLEIHKEPANIMLWKIPGGSICSLAIIVPFCFKVLAFFWSDKCT